MLNASQRSIRLAQGSTCPIAAEPTQSVSVVIPIRNEEHSIRQCLDSILANDYPRNLLEILVVDGRSTDVSRQVVSDYSRRFPVVRLLDNPNRIQAAALNIGFRTSKADIIIRADAHTVYAADYIRKCVEVLEDTGAANVGGLQRATGGGALADAIAVASTTPFGVGNAHFRYAEKEMWVDTVYLGAWRRSTLEALGGFNEEWAINEDYEFNYRLCRAGGKVFLSPHIVSWYHVRDSFPRLVRQYFRYGLWKVRTLFLHPTSIRWRQLVPPVFLLSLILSLAAALRFSLLGLVVPISYLATNVVTSAVLSLRRGKRLMPLLPLVFATIHISWAVGFFVGLGRWGAQLLYRWVHPPTCKGGVN